MNKNNVHIFYGYLIYVCVAVLFIILFCVFETKYDLSMIKDESKPLHVGEHSYLYDTIAAFSIYYALATLASFVVFVVLHLLRLFKGAIPLTSYLVWNVIGSILITLFLLEIDGCL